jgi:predicted dehydrogenase
MRVALVGTGLQARRRAPVLAQSKHDTLAVVASSSEARAMEFARAYDCDFTGDWRSAATRDDVDAVVVCTAPDSHAEIAIAAFGAGKHVLCEKPLSRTMAEAEAMVAAARKAGRTLKCGFNHRHHPAIVQAKALVDRGQFGRLIIGRCRYGLCGRPGYEKEWRADPGKSAGGHLMEMGIHGLDLYRWFFGEIADVACMTGALYFPMAPLDDNGMAILRARSGALLSLHSSLTQWKNLFSFEVIGEEGYFAIEGLGASYGTEQLIVGRRDFEAPFQDVVTEYRGGDRSWQLEWEEFTSAIAEGRRPLGDGRDGLEALRLVFAAYDAERERRVLSVAGHSAP